MIYIRDSQLASEIMNINVHNKLQSYRYSYIIPQLSPKTFTEITDGVKKTITYDINHLKL